MQRVRLIVDPPSPGAWNMAVDEALLLNAAQFKIATLRFYTWERPTLSLGYFQSIRRRDQHVASRDCPIVRRSSGGGAILHDCELTYSFSTPLASRAAQPAQQWYDLFHSTLIETLRELGATTVRCPATDSQLESRFLCFQRRTAGDVVLGPAKVAGSAQRRHARALLQHGSILLNRSQAAPELLGIGELSGERIDVRTLRQAWTSCLAKTRQLSWDRGELGDPERQLAHQIAQEKFQTAAWTNRR